MISSWNTYNVVGKIKVNTQAFCPMSSSAPYPYVYLGDRGLSFLCAPSRCILFTLSFLFFHIFWIIELEIYIICDAYGWNHLSSLYEIISFSWKIFSFLMYNCVLAYRYACKLHVKTKGNRMTGITTDDERYVGLLLCFACSWAHNL